MQFESSAELGAVLGSEAFLELLQDPAHVIRITTQQGRFVFASNGPLGHSNVPPEALRGRNAYDYFPAGQALFLELSKGAFPHHAARIILQMTGDTSTQKEEGWIEVESQIVGRFVVNRIRATTERVPGWTNVPLFLPAHVVPSDPSAP